MTNHIYATAVSRLALTAFVGALVLPLLTHAQTPAKPAAMQHNVASGATMAGGGMDMKSMMKDMNDKMGSMKMTGNADVDFAMMMRIHHLGAIDMAQAELRDGKNAQMHRMARNIITAQKKEISELDKFIAKSGLAPAKTGK
ncbi:MAG: DUF305 domain-containing protein [Burkholderiaceae bacterium]